MIREAGPLEGRIKADTVVALKAGDKQRTQELRLFTAALKKERILITNKWPLVVWLMFLTLSVTR